MDDYARTDKTIQRSRKERITDMNKTKIDRSEGLTAPKVIVLSLLSSFFALSLPISLVGSDISKYASWIICIAAGILVVLTSKNFSGVILPALVFTFIVSYSGSPVLIALVIGTVVACGIYSSVIASARLKQIILPIIAPWLTCAIAFAITGDIALAVISLAIFIPSAAMGIAARRGAERASAIGIFAGVAAFELIIGVLTHIYLQNGYLSVEIIREAASYFWTETVKLLAHIIETAGNTSLTDDVMIQVRSLATSITNLLVGITAAALITVGYFAQKVQHSFFERFELEELQNTSGASIKASSSAAIVYIIAHIFSFTSSASNAPSFAASLGSNISLILLPLLLCVGFNFVADLPKKIGFFALLAWGGIALAAFILSSSVVEMIALLGAFYTIIACIDAWAGEHYRKGEDK